MDRSNIGNIRNLDGIMVIDCYDGEGAQVRYMQHRNGKSIGESFGSLLYAIHNISQHGWGVYLPNEVVVDLQLEINKMRRRIDDEIAKNYYTKAAIDNEMAERVRFRKNCLTRNKRLND